MLFKEFARKHYVCDYGEEQLQRYGNRDLREMWHDHPNGIALFWLLSRAQVDQSALVRCACECTRELLPLFSEPASARSVIDTVEAWCDRKTSYQNLLAAEEQAGKMAQSADGARDARLRWEAIHQLACCASSAIYAPGLASYIALALAAAGKGSAEESQARLAAIIRSSFSFEEVQLAVAADLPSPEPRQQAVDEVLDQSASLMREFDELIRSWETAKATQESAFHEAHISLEQVTRYSHESISREHQELVTQKLAELDASEGVEAPQLPASNRGLRRRREMI